MAEPCAKCRKPWVCERKGCMDKAASAPAALATSNEIHQARNSQHVLKAEGASPDATDRENCANASPDGGPMGAGQAAAAAPNDASTLAQDGTV